MNVSRFFATGAACMFLAGPVAAQVVGIGTTKGGLTPQVTSSISNVVSKYAGFQMRGQPMAGAQQFVPLVNVGKLEFGVANEVQTYMALTGTGLSQGHKYANLRIVATMMRLRAGMVVADKSGIKTVADLKGKRIPFGFKGSPLFHHLITAGMANGGISWDDVKKVPTVGLRQSWNIFKQGKIDMAWFGVGSGITREMQASISGGIRYLSFDDTLGPKRMEKVLPQGFYGGKDARKYEYATVKAPSPLPGIKSTVKVFGFDYLLWAGKGVSEEIVYQVTKAMFEHEKEIKSASAVWRSHKSTRMGKNHGPTYRYHPGAIRLYKEKGVWKR